MSDLTQAERDAINSGRTTLTATRFRHYQAARRGVTVERLDSAAAAERAEVNAAVRRTVWNDATRHGVEKCAAIRAQLAAEYPGEFRPW